MVITTNQIWIDQGKPNMVKDMASSSNMMIVMIVVRCYRTIYHYNHWMNLFWSFTSTSMILVQREPSHGHTQLLGYGRARRLCTKPPMVTPCHTTWVRSHEFDATDDLVGQSVICCLTLRESQRTVVPCYVRLCDLLSPWDVVCCAACGGFLSSPSSRALQSSCKTSSDATARSRAVAAPTASCPSEIVDGW